MVPAPPADLRFNSIDEIKQIHRELRDSFDTGKSTDIGFRKHQLKQLSFLLNDNVEAIVEAIGKDLGRCRFESVFAEIMLTTNSAIEAYENVEKWAKPEKKWAGPVWALHRPTESKTPKGTVLVLGAWNYPISVQIGPMIGALAAGCTLVLKPSEIAAHSARLLAELWPKYMDPSMSRCVNGGIEETTALLDLEWEHIFYTGNGKVGRIIAEKAAKYLCPTTLELGGKSPTIVDASANLNIAAHRIMWAKSINCGQTCIAPDYVIATSEVQGKLIAELKKVEKEFWPQGVENSKDYGRIINDRQWSRLAGIVDNTKGEIVIGGKKDQKDRFLAPTIIQNCPRDDASMQDEIFGPILPMITVKDTEDAIKFIKKNDTPLALYVFANDSITKDIMNKTRSGGVVQGDLMIHYVVSSLPFGGTGPSGYGSYHGKAGFDTFTHTRSSVHAPASGVTGWLTEKLMASRYPPYTNFNLAQFRALLGKSPSFKRPSKIYDGKDSRGLFFGLSTFSILVILAVAAAFGRDPQLINRVHIFLPRLS